MKYEILEEFETTSGITWQKRKYSSGKVVYRNSKDFRKNRKQQSYASASKHKVDTTNEQIGGERAEEEIFTDDFQHRIIQPSEFYGDYISRMEEWYINEPEITIREFSSMRDETIDRLERKVQEQGEEQPGWDDRFDRYHYYIKYMVIREGAVFDTSRRYTQALESLDELQLSFQGIINSLLDIATGYDNILVTEWGIQGKVIRTQ